MINYGGRFQHEALEIPKTGHAKVEKDNFFTLCKQYFLYVSVHITRSNWCGRKNGKRKKDQELEGMTGAGVMLPPPVLAL